MNEEKSEGKVMLATLPAEAFLRAVRACAHACDQPNSPLALGCVLIRGSGRSIKVMSTNKTLFSRVEIRDVAVHCDSFEVAVSASEIIPQLAPAVSRNPKAMAEVFAYEDLSYPNASHAINGRKPDPENQYGTSIYIECDNVVVSVGDESCSYPIEQVGKLEAVANGEGRVAWFSASIPLLEKAVRAAKASRSTVLRFSVLSNDKPVALAGLGDPMDEEAVWKGIICPVLTY